VDATRLGTRGVCSQREGRRCVRQRRAKIGLTDAHAHTLTRTEGIGVLRAPLALREWCRSFVTSKQALDDTTAWLHSAWRGKAGSKRPSNDTLRHFLAPLYAAPQLAGGARGAG